VFFCLGLVGVVFLVVFLCLVFSCLFVYRGFVYVLCFCFLWFGLNGACRVLWCWCWLGLLFLLFWFLLIWCFLIISCPFDDLFVVIVAWVFVFVLFDLSMVF